MKIAVIGSRTLTVRDLEKYIPKDTTEIISGGANGIDRCAKEFAVKKTISDTRNFFLNIKYMEDMLH